MNIVQYLTDKQISFEICKHPTTATAAGLAEAMHIGCNDVAKTVLLRLNGGFKYLLAILPGSHVVDLLKLSKALGGTHVELATKPEIAARCADCEPGVLPPFGTEYGLETVIDPSIEAHDNIVFQGNSRHEAIRMRYRDFYDLEHPLVVEFAVPAGHPKPVAVANE